MYLMMQENSTTMKRKYLKRFRKTPYPCKQVMSEQETSSNGDIEKDFQSTGRTGRRNALADVLGVHKEVSTSELPLKLEKLTTNDMRNSETSAMKQNNYTDIESKDTSTNVNPSNKSG